MRKQFLATMTALAEKDERVVLILGDIGGFLFRGFAERFPQRFFNMGICENTLVSVAAGLGSQGFIPFVHTIAPFVTERSYEQIKLDLCYNRFPAAIVSCGASFDYAWDGASHHATTDLAILRLLPGMEVMQPGSPKELDALLRARYDDGQPKYYRLSDHPHGLDLPVEFGRIREVQRRGKARLTVLTAGPILGNVVAACKDLEVNILYTATIKPFDAAALASYRQTKVLVVSDAFGLFEAVAAVPGLRAECHGLPDRFFASYGTVAEIRKSIGLDAEGIRRRVLEAQEG